MKRSVTARHESDYSIPVSGGRRTDGCGALLRRCMAVVVLLASLTASVPTSGAQTVRPVLAVAALESLSDVGTAATLVASGDADGAVMITDGGLSDAAAGVVRAARPRSVVIVGGVAAVPESVEERLKELSPGVGVERLGGVDRADTALQAAQRALEGVTDAKVAIANGWSLADVGVAASLVAAGGAHAVLYGDIDGLGADSVELLGSVSVAEVVAVGGTAVLSEAAFEAVAAAAEASSSRRLWGATRVETAAQVARRAAGDCTHTVVLANGWQDADVGVAATLAAALSNSAVLYAQGADEAGEATVAALNRLDPVRIVVIGGVESVSESLRGSFSVGTTRAVTRYTEPADAARHALESTETACDASGGNGSTGSSGGGTARIPVVVTPPGTTTPGEKPQQVPENPTATNGEVTTSAGTPHVFSAADFNFTAVSAGDTLASVEIEMPPSDGLLTLNGMAVTADQSVSKIQLDNSELSYTPPSGISSSQNYASFRFKVTGTSGMSSALRTMFVHVTGEAARTGNLPTASNGTVSTPRNMDFVFAAAHFRYADLDGDALHSVKITRLPAARTGVLSLNGVPISSNDLPLAVIAIDVSSGRLVYSPTANASGVAYASFTFRVNDGTADSVAEYTMTVDVTRPPNVAATGVPTISQSGTTTLEAKTDGIADDNRLPSVFDYKWKRYHKDDVDQLVWEADVGTASSYTPTPEEVDNQFIVEVSFVDRDGYSEGPLISTDNWLRESLGSDLPENAIRRGWLDSGDLAVGATIAGVIQGGFTEDSFGELTRYARDVPDFFELTGMTDGTTYQLNLQEPGAGHGDIIGFYTPVASGVLEFVSRGDTEDVTWGNTQVRQTLFTAGSKAKYFVGISGSYTAKDIDYTVALIAPAEDDIPASTSTTEATTATAASSGVIEQLYDVDWHRTQSLSGGESYVAYLQGASSNTLFDPVIVGIYNSLGVLQTGTSDEYDGVGRDASVVFTPSVTGVYYVAVSSMPKSGRRRTTRDATGKGHLGAYMLTVTAVSADVDNSIGTTTLQIGPEGDNNTLTGDLTQDFEYTSDYWLEHINDEEYFKLAVQSDNIYEIYVKSIDSPGDSPPLIKALSIPSRHYACRNLYTSRAVFKSDVIDDTDSDMMEDETEIYHILVRTLDPGGVSGQIAVKLLDKAGDNLSNYRNRCG